MVSMYISRIIMLVFGTLYPAYRSYKAIKNKEVREYVKWMMYWIVFAFFTTAESLADVFISWLPLYYEVKVIFIIWLLSPATKGSSILYRRFVHPRLLKHEKKIDKYIDKAKENSYATMMELGRKTVNVATDTFVKTAITGQGALIQTLRRYGSMQQMDQVDGAQPLASLPAANEQPFNPDDDIDLLQQQYTSAEAYRSGYTPPQEQGLQNRRSQSEMNLATANQYRVMGAPLSKIAHSDADLTDPNDEDYVPSARPGERTSPLSRRTYRSAGSEGSDGEGRARQRAAEEDPTMFNYSSATLPRMKRTTKAPLYEYEPDTDSPRTRRQKGRTRSRKNDAE